MDFIALVENGVISLDDYDSSFGFNFKKCVKLLLDIMRGNYE